MFGGGSSQPVEQQQQQPQAQQTQQESFGAGCDYQAKNFTQCMDDTQGNMQACNWYLEQLKMCQQAAKPY